MKRRNKLLCLFLVALMVLTVSGPLLVSAASHRVDSGSGSGVTYNGETVASFNVHTLTFSSDDYLVLPFAGYAGGTYTLNGQYSQAVALGYDVVGMINGDFFNMSNGATNDYLVVNGEVVIGDTAMHSSNGMTCILSDGTFTTVSASQLRFATYINGTEVPGGISYVNRRPNRSGESGWTDALYYFDSNAASDKCPLAGVAVICKRLNGTVLSIGATMEAEVVSVSEVANANGINPAKDEFLLYVRATSPLAKTMKALKKGDSVTVTTSETVAASADITTNATSILANIGYLVKDGLNIAASSAFNDTDPHGNKYKAQWTAFGTKADGSWVFFTSEGASGSSGLTQAQVAEYLIGLGCTDVIRLDGGGSVAMYVSDAGDGKPGYKENHGRNVPDCLMVVKRSSKALQPSDEVKKTLNDLIAQAKNSSDENVKAALAYAQSVAGSAKSVSGDYTSAMMRLKDALSGKGALSELIGLASGVSFTNYSEYALTRLREAYVYASEVFGSSTATPSDVSMAYAQLEKWYNATGSYSTSDATYSQLTSANAFYLSHFNTSIQESDCTIFTAGMSIAQSAANLKWARAILLRKNAHGSYVVEKNINGAAVGSDTYVPDQLGFTTVPEDCIVIGAHGASNNPVGNAATAGKILVPHGFSISEQTIGIGAYFAFENANAGGHTYDWKVTKEPTCTEKGAEILTCTICGETTGTARTIDALTHHYDLDGVCARCEDLRKIGDIDGNGKVEATDYMLLKRAILGTRKLSDEEAVIADVNQDGTIDANDYMFLKRGVLGTFKLPDRQA